MTAHKGKSGQPTVVKMYCQTKGFDCPLNKAYSLHADYVQKLIKLDDINRFQGVRLRMGQFVKELVESACAGGIKDLTPEKIWGGLAPGKDIYVTKPKNYSHTHLKQDIEKQTATVGKARDAVEAAAKELVSFISQESFQKHLINSHSNTLISEEEKARYYTTPPKVAIREIENACARLTEHLAQSRAGMEFLRKLMSRQELQKLPAFAQVWDNISVLKKQYGNNRQEFGQSLEAIGKFFYNVSPVLTEPATIASTGSGMMGNVGNVRTVVDFLKTDEIKQYVAFLDEKFGEKISTWLRERGGCFARKGMNVVDNLKGGDSWKNLVFSWQDGFNAFDDPDFKKAIEQNKAIADINSAWLFLSLDVLSFSISMVEFSGKLEDAGLKDWLGACNEVMSLVEKAAGKYETSLLSQGLDAKKAGALAKNLGIATSVLTVVVAVCNVSESINRKDFKEIALNVAGLGLAAGSLYATIVGAAFASGVLAIAAIALAVIAAKMADHPLVTYLEDTAWGANKNRIVSVEDTMREFYKRFYSFTVKFVGYPGNRKLSYVELISSALEDAETIYIQLTEKGKPGTKPDRFFIKDRKVTGKGEIIKVAGSWLAEKAFYPKAIRIYGLDEIWPQSATPGKRFELKLGIDKERKYQQIDQMALKGSVTYSLT